MNTLKIYLSFVHPFEIIPSISILKGHLFNVRSNRRSLNISWLFLNIEILYKI